MTRTRKLLTAGVAIIGLACAAFLLRPRTDAAPDAVAGRPAHSAAALTVTVAPPRVADWPLQVDASGWLAAWQEVVVSAQVGGQMITSVNADVGDSVAQNDPLAELSATSLENDILELDAALDSARASQDQAAADAERARQLSGGSSISKQQVAEYMATERKATADVAQAEAKLASAKLDLSHVQITAVAGGVVSSRSAAVGEVVSEGQELFRLIRDGRVEWQAEVPLARLRDITVGTPVSIPSPMGAIAGQVRRIAPTASESNGRVIVYVSLEQPEEFDMPKTGIMLSGTFRTGTQDALSVPASAVVMQDGFSYVYILENGEATTVSRIRVETGRRQDDRVEITSDLSGDAQVVQAGGAFLSDGAVVRVTAADTDIAETVVADASQGDEATQTERGE